MKNLSTEVIKIDGKEYTLFLNRKGVVAFEKYSKDEQSKIQQIQEKYKSSIEALEKSDCKIDDNTNPFEDLDDFDNIEEDTEIEKEIEKAVYSKLYWIMLYENHKLSLNAVKDLYEQACKEYGEDKVRQLADQMVEEINIAPNTEANDNLKNLKALKPKK